MSIYNEIKIKTWQDFARIAFKKPYKKYIYRGHADSSWELVTTLQRKLSEYGINRRYWKEREQSIISTFQKRAHPFLRHLPNEENENRRHLEWLSIMQHFGAPTRLLDWTYSPFVAAFFALESMSSPSCVFQLEYKKLIEANIKHDGDDYFNKGFDEKHKFVMLFPYEPRLQNERLISQQGLFLYQNDLDENVEELIHDYEIEEKILNKYIFNFSKTKQKNAIKALKMMNVDNSKLFPDIEGLSKSLSLELIEPKGVL